MRKFINKTTCFFMSALLAVSACPINVFASTAIEGKDQIMISELKDWENIYKATYSIDTTGLSNDVSWSFLGDPDGLMLLNASGIKNSQVDLFVFKDKIENNEITLQANVGNETYTKEVEIVKPREARFKKFVISKQSDTDAVDLDNTDLKSFQGYAFFPKHKGKLKMSYSFGVKDINNQTITGTYTVKKNSAGENLAGVVVKKNDETGNIEVEVDRTKLTSKIVRFQAVVEGKTPAGVNYQVVINYTITVDGEVGSAANRYTLDIAFDESFKEAPFVVSGNERQIVKLKTFMQNYEYQVENYDVSYDVADNGRPFISVGGPGNNEITITPNTPTGVYTITGTANGVSDEVHLYVVSETDKYARNVFGENVTEITTVTKEKSSFLIEIYGDEASKEFEISPSHNGFTVEYDPYEMAYRLIKSETVPAGIYKINSKVKSGVIVNELTLDVQDTDVMPEAYFGVDIKASKNVVNKHMTDTITIPFEVSTFYNNALQDMAYEIKLDKVYQGVSIKNNQLVINSSAIQEEEIGVITYLKNYPTIQSKVFVSVVDSTIIDPSNYLIEAALSGGVDASNITVPEIGYLNIPISAKIMNGKGNVDESYTVKLKDAAAGISVENNVLRIASNAIRGTYSIVANMDNNPKVEQTLAFRLLGGGYDQNGLQVNFGLKKNIAYIPTEGNLDVINYNLDVTLQGMPEDDRPYSLEISPETDGITIDQSKRWIIVNPKAKAGKYLATLKMLDGSGIVLESYFDVKPLSQEEKPVTISLNLKNTEAYIPKENQQENFIEYDVEVKEGNEQVTDKTYDLKIEPNTTGIRVDNESGKIYISELAAKGTYTMTATLEDGTLDSKTFDLKEIKGDSNTDPGDPNDPSNPGDPNDPGNPDPEKQLDAIITFDKEEITIPSGTKTEKINYTVTIKENGEIVTDKDFGLILEPQNDGVVLNESKKTITIDSKAAKGQYALKIVLLDESDFVKEKSFVLKEAVTNIDPTVKQILITSPTKLFIPAKGETNYSLTAKVYLNNEDITDKESIVWTLGSKVDGIKVENSKIYLSDSVDEQTISVVATLGSNKKIKVTQEIDLRKVINSNEVPSKIVLRGFDIQNANENKFYLEKFSGVIKKITAHTYNSNGDEIKGHEVYVDLKNNYKGMKLIKGQDFNTYYLCINSMFEAKDIALVAYTDGSFSNEISVPVSIYPASYVSSDLSFEKKSLQSKDKFGAVANVTNRSSSDLSVTLTIALYRNNQLEMIQEKTEKIKSGKSAELITRLQLPGDLNGVTVKAFLLQGETALYSTKILGQPIMIKN